MPVVRPGNNSGEQLLSIKSADNAIAHQFQITIAPVTYGSNWVPVPGKSKCTAKNLVRGKEYAVRVFVTGTGQEFAYSTSVTFIAI